MSNVSTLNTGFIVLEHDLFQQSVEIATGYILPDALARTPKLTLQPVITCLNQPLANAYIETNDNSTNPPPATMHPSSKCSFFTSFVWNQSSHTGRHFWFWQRFSPVRYRSYKWWKPVWRCSCSVNSGRGYFRSR